FPGFSRSGDAGGGADQQRARPEPPPGSMPLDPGSQQRSPRSRQRAPTGLGSVPSARQRAPQRSPPGSAALATSPPACRGLSRAPHGFSTLRCGLGGVRRAVRHLVSATRSGAAPPAVVDESRGTSVDAVGG